MPDELGERTLSQHTDKLIPVFTDGTPILWEDDNDAHILGNLYEAGADDPAASAEAGLVLVRRRLEHDGA